MNIEEFAADLTAVDWAASEVAWGMQVESVPDNLLDLAQVNDRSTGNEVYWRLDNCVVVQNTLYSAAELAVPFLIRIVRDGGEVARYFAAELLIQIGFAEDPIDQGRGGRCRSAIAGAIDTFYDLSRSSDPEQQLGAIHCLDMVEGDRPRLVRALRDLSGEDLDHRVLDLIDTVLDS